MLITTPTPQGQAVPFIAVPWWFWLLILLACILMMPWIILVAMVFTWLVVEVFLTWLAVRQFLKLRQPQRQGS